MSFCVTSEGASVRVSGIELLQRRMNTRNCGIGVMPLYSLYIEYVFLLLSCVIKDKNIRWFIQNPTNGRKRKERENEKIDRQRYLRNVNTDIRK